MEAKIGVIVPVYGTEQYVSDCIKSILAQTYKHFRLILIDDASPDNAGSICDEYAKTDTRITVIHQENKGVTCARAKGVSIADDCDYITFVDSDDTMPSDALSLLKSQMTKDTDIVISYRVPNIPAYRTINKQQISKEEYRFGLLNRKISPAPWGKLFRRGLFDDFVFDIPRAITVGEDLLMNLRLAYNTEKQINVIHSDVYNYNINDGGATKQFVTTPYFESLWHQLIITSIPNPKEKEAYTRNSISFRLRRYRALGGFKCYDNTALIQTDFYKELSNDITRYRYFMSLKKRILFFSTNLAIRKFLIDFPQIPSRIWKRIRSTPFYAWRRVLRRAKKYRVSANRLSEGYSKEAPIKFNARKRVVCIYDNTIKIGGLADRLRGILSVYYICRAKKNIDFKILFSHPFNIARYLIPNQVDWSITKDSLSYNLPSTDLCMITTSTGGHYERRKQERWFRKEFDKQFNEFHVRTNAPFSFQYDFAELFNELFRPSPLLESIINHQKNLLGENYISVSFRFLDLLGDFNETFGRNIQMTEEKRLALINKCKIQIDDLHKRHPGWKILVNSDSTTFLDIVRPIEYTYIIPGTISHVDNPTPVAENVHDKTFADFFMIANAKSIHLVIAEQMYDSNFPYVASLLYGRPFHKIYC